MGEDVRGAARAAVSVGGEAEALVKRPPPWWVVVAGFAGPVVFFGGVLAVAVWSGWSPW